MATEQIAVRLPEPLLTPTTKAEQGDHDENRKRPGSAAESRIARNPWCFGRGGRGRLERL